LSAENENGIIAVLRESQNNLFKMVCGYVADLSMEEALTSASRQEKTGAYYGQSPKPKCKNQTSKKHLDNPRILFFDFC